MKRALHIDVHGAHFAAPGLILSVAALLVGHPTEPGPGPSRPGPLYRPGVAMLLASESGSLLKYTNQS
jgi:hypothetical protein